MEEIRDDYEIVETVDHEYMVLVGGFQVGGEIDRSGAGNLTFKSKEEAENWFRRIMPRKKRLYAHWVPATARVYFTIDDSKLSLPVPYHIRKNSVIVHNRKQAEKVAGDRGAHLVDIY